MAAKIKHPTHQQTTPIAKEELLDVKPANGFAQDRIYGDMADLLKRAKTEDLPEVSAEMIRGTLKAARKQHGTMPVVDAVTAMARDNRTAEIELHKDQLKGEGFYLVDEKTRNHVDFRTWKDTGGPLKTEKKDPRKKDFVDVYDFATAYAVKQELKNQGVRIEVEGSLATDKIRQYEQQAGLDAERIPEPNVTDVSGEARHAKTSKSGSIKRAAAVAALVIFTGVGAANAAPQSPQARPGIEEKGAAGEGEKDKKVTVEKASTTLTAGPNGYAARLPLASEVELPRDATVLLPTGNQTIKDVEKGTVIRAVDGETMLTAPKDAKQTLPSGTTISYDEPTDIALQPDERLELTEKRDLSIKKGQVRMRLGKKSKLSLPAGSRIHFQEGDEGKLPHELQPLTPAEVLGDSSTTMASTATTQQEKFSEERKMVAGPNGMQVYYPKTPDEKTKLPPNAMLTFTQPGDIHLEDGTLMYANEATRVKVEKGTVILRENGRQERANEDMTYSFSKGDIAILESGTYKMPGDKKVSIVTTERKDTIEPPKGSLIEAPPGGYIEVPPSAELTEPGTPTAYAQHASSQYVGNYDINFGRQGEGEMNIYPLPDGSYVVRGKDKAPGWSSRFGGRVIRQADGSLRGIVHKDPGRSKEYDEEWRMRYGTGGREVDIDVRKLGERSRWHRGFNHRAIWGTKQVDTFLDENQ